MGVKVSGAMKRDVKKVIMHKIENAAHSFRTSQFRRYAVYHGGFTLLEIMIALAIIGTALTVIVHTVNFHANVMYDNTLATQLMQTAKEKMNELETAPGNTGGDISPGISYENTATPIKETRLVELRTIVRGHGRQVVLNQLVINRGEWQIPQK